MTGFLCFLWPPHPREEAPMIAPALVAEVKRLLAEGKLSQRKIARQTGVSRGSVALIAQGKRPDYPPRRDEEELFPVGPPARCPTCGAMVYPPCRLCRLRELQAQAKTPPRLRLSDFDVRVGLQLNDEHRARYEEVRRRPGHPTFAGRREEVLP
jgi:transcriptional regulator with XRE-family HTH domain